MEQKPVSEVAKQLKADVLKSDTPDDTKAKEEAQAKDAIIASESAAAIKQAKTVVNVPIKRGTLADDPTRAINRLTAQFPVLLDPNATPGNRRMAHRRVVEVVSVNAKRNVMEALLDFYIKNKNHPEMDEMRALQHISDLDKSTKIRVESLYVTMRTIVSGKRGRINLDVIREVFKNDDLVNWLALVQSGNYVRG